VEIRKEGLLCSIIIMRRVGGFGWKIVVIVVMIGRLNERFDIS
jgi:hypothetical protein